MQICLLSVRLAATSLVGIRALCGGRCLTVPRTAPRSTALGAGVLESVFEVAALGDTDEPFDDAVVVFDDERRQRSHLVLVGDLLFLVDIDLGELHVLVVGLQLLEDRILRLTRATPVGVKVCQSNSHRAADRCADAVIRVSTPSLAAGDRSAGSRNA